MTELDRLALLVTDCDAAGPITFSAARVVVKAVLEGLLADRVAFLRFCGFEPEPWQAEALAEEVAQLRG